MRFCRYIITGAALALLTACNGKLPVTPAGEASGAIVLKAGISEGQSGVQTKALDAGHAGTASGGAHKAFSENTKLTLRVDGTWLGKADGRLPHGSVASTKVTQTTTATIGAETASDSKHNNVNFEPSEKLFWDDYGSAAPANMSTEKGGTVSNGTDGRGKGLDIFAVAVNGVTTAPSVSSWTALPWSVGEVIDGAINQKSGWSTKDLLTSNNVRAGGDGAYKFDDYLHDLSSSPKQSSNLLVFTHAMTKVTVNLTARDGFEENKFVEEPKVTLLSFNYTGTVNVDTKASTPTPDTKTNISAHLAKVKATSAISEWSDAPATWATSHQTQFDAIVFPGNRFLNDTDILRIEADGNIYYVNATQINVVNTEQDNTFEQAKNYIFNITINKTDIDVEATIKDWVAVEATNETPVINVTDAYGHEGTGFNRSFDFYRSTAVTGSYLTGITEGNHTVVDYVAAAGEPVVPAHYSLETPMYWPNHSTHYFFRGIWPLVNSQDSGSQQLGPTTAQVKANSVEVANVAYRQGYYPSDLMIGAPRKNDGTYDETCKQGAHEKSSGANGICATEGKIRMNFEYAMSQVIVNLTTSEGNDKVIFDQYTTVEILGGYVNGEIKLSDESSDFTDKTVADYTMNRANLAVHTSYHDAIIPQSLVDGGGNATLKFRITVKSEDTYDKYETVLGIKDIQVTENAVKKSITAWERSKKYTYTLRITKTGIKVEATVKDWIEVDGGDDIWL